MKRRFVLAVIMSAFLLSITAKQVLADGNINIIVNGKLLNLVRQPEFVNGRIFAPVRPILESIGAAVGWDSVSGQISAYTHEHYVIIRIGSLNIRYGRFRYDETGNFSYETQLIYVSETPPVISGGHTMAPLRAIAEGLGAEVIWDETSSTVYINLPGNTPPPKPASPTPAPAPLYDSRYFKEISASQAQRWYDAGTPYILYYYSHLSESGMAVLKWAQQAAARHNLMVYGVNTDSTIYDNTGEALRFIWNYLDRNSDSVKPSFLFINPGGAVTPLIRPRDVRSIDFCMTAFTSNASRIRGPARRNRKGS